jgi:ectoine hydroxylase-related dioxygenase (phytanoyl-CoA dioxygenase family)
MSAVRSSPTARGSDVDRPDDAELDRLANELERDGICVVRGALDPALLAAWAAAFEDLVRERERHLGGLAPRERGRFYVTLPWRAPFADPAVFANPKLLGVLDRVFAQEYVMVQLGADTPVLGSDYQEIHRDYRPLFSDDVVTPLYGLAVNFPLCRVTIDNGPLELARGTHRVPRREALQKIAAGEIPVESFPMELGDVAIRTPLALHRGTPNRTDRPRPMVVMGFVMHWLHTPKVDLTLPRALYDGLTEAQRARLRCQVVDQLPDRTIESYVEFKY